MLGSEESVPVVGIQIVAAARPETAGQTQQAVNRELARLRELEGQAGKGGKGGKGERRALRLSVRTTRRE
jgi:hypothetical protein